VNRISKSAFYFVETEAHYFLPYCFGEVTTPSATAWAFSPILFREIANLQHVLGDEKARG
jgi:hypothetical protein